MPWNRTKDCIPPANVELVVFGKGKRETKKLDIFDIMDGRGGIDANAPEFWAYPTEKELPDPEPYAPKGIGHTDASERVMDELVKPKLDSEGVAPRIDIGVYGHDGFVKD